MNPESARQRIETYIDGWKGRNRNQIISVLAPNCVVVESHGPTYRSRQVIQRWIDVWFAQGGNVSKWEVTSFYFANETAFFEWDFACSTQWGRAEIEGASLVKFENEQIVEIREYRRTSSPFEWAE